MQQEHPWKTPFGRLVIGSAAVAALAGFGLAAAAAGYFRGGNSADTEANAQVEQQPIVEVKQETGPVGSINPSNDPQGYEAALAQLPAQQPAGGVISDGSGPVEATQQSSDDQENAVNQQQPSQDSEEVNEE